MPDQPAPSWTEDDSATFLKLADVAVPGRREQTDVLLSLIPAAQDDAFAGADLACGEGLLSEFILDRFPRARLAAMDGSREMLAKAAVRLRRFGPRASVREFDLADRGWLDEIESPLRCAVSSLCFHHLDGPTKRRLFGDLAARLEPGGALLIADIVAPASDVIRRSWAHTWDEIARSQSIELTGDTDAYRTFQELGWNAHAITEPEPREMPSRLYEQLKWLEAAGFTEVDCFWMRAGVAVYGGYR